jgi:fermentation-respiration switch protein FrsA (DUF1100 family)
MRRKRNWFVSVAWAVLAILIFILALFWLGQRQLMYYPTPLTAAPPSVGLADVETVSFRTTDGITLHGWLLPARLSPRRATVIVFNGNAGNRSYRADLGQALRLRGLSVLLFDYRGFGDNAGTPTEDGLVLDARAAREYLRTRSDTSRERVVYFGESLGTAVATRLAVEAPPAALILRSPFTSFVDLGRIHFPYLPVRWLLRDRYASIDRISSIGCPVLVIAGTQDGIVPLELSQRLFDAATSPKKMMIVQGADHNDLELVEGEQVIETTVHFVEEHL